ncbi:MAG: DUF2321 domain-containing protein [Schleiferilactobacillus perolens]|jgi:hypothetical protein|uniref:DUF2321 domain-containing protein n=1 Tax=Schleiferilactobacillus perolens TaxID=100468 RepID=UPI0039EB858E|nr:DUF2321 domain-containing protein [Schleiferilactobacillus harbinensis]MCI1913512.1 DUF2321 domain-containing protein [Schleiferilactobacillus harbinensis]
MSISSKRYKMIVCMNGHQLCVNEEPDKNVCGVCPKCGAALIDECPVCHEPIPGIISVSTWAVNPTIATPHYCPACQNPYPWTADTINRALQLLNRSSKFSKQDQVEFAQIIPHLIIETEYTKSAKNKYQCLIRKAGPATTNGLKEILAKVCSADVRKSLWQI